jgi:hypothetical protein
MYVEAKLKNWKKEIIEKKNTPEIGIKTNRSFCIKKRGLVTRICKYFSILNILQNARISRYLKRYQKHAILNMGAILNS